MFRESKNGNKVKWIDSGGHRLALCETTLGAVGAIKHSNLSRTNLLKVALCAVPDAIGPRDVFLKNTLCMRQKMDERMKYFGMCRRIHASRLPGIKRCIAFRCMHIQPTPPFILPQFLSHAALCCNSKSERDSRCDCA